MLKNAREIGVLQYSDITPNRDGTVSVRVTQALDSALDKLAEGDVKEVEVVDELPDYLKNANLKFRQFVNNIKKENKRKANPYFTVLEFNPDSKSLTIRTENLPSSGMLILSLAEKLCKFNVG